MKQVTQIILALCVVVFQPHTGRAQKPGNWTLGLTFQPCYYWKYNKADWNNRPNSYPVSPRKFNGWASGITASYAFSDRLGIGTEFTFSRQEQDFNVMVLSHTGTDGKISYVYAHDDYTRLSYLKLPVYATVNMEIGYESGLFLKLFAGPQLSYLTNYRSEFRQHDFDHQTFAVLPDVITNTQILTPSAAFQDFVNFDGSHSVNSWKTPYLYQHFELGVLAGIVLEKRLFNRYIFSVGTRYELGITNSENPNVNRDTLVFGGFGGSNNGASPGPATHNRRFVLNLGFAYILGR